MSEKQGGAAVSSPQDVMSRLINGYLITQLLYVTAKLGICDLLKTGPLPVSGLAGTLGVPPDPLARILSLLAGLGLLALDTSGCFCLTPYTRLLITDHPQSLHHAALFAGETPFWQAAGGLLQTVRTGETAFGIVHQNSFFRYLAEHPAAGEIYNGVMQEMSRQGGALLADKYTFPEAGIVVDVGGGVGGVLSILLKRNPRLQGILFDSPQVIKAAVSSIGQQALSERCRCVPGDCFSSVPGGGTHYLLKNLLHGYDDQAALRILKCCRRHMPGGALLLIVEFLLPAGGGVSPGPLLDLHMLIHSGGRERSLEEYTQLLHEAGFDYMRRIPLAEEVCILEAALI